MRSENTFQSLIIFFSKKVFFFFLNEIKILFPKIKIRGGYKIKILPFSTQIFGMKIGSYPI